MSITINKRRLLPVRRDKQVGLTGAGGAGSSVAGGVGLSSEHNHDIRYFTKTEINEWFEEVPNDGNPYLRAKLPLGCDGEIQAFTDSGQFPPQTIAGIAPTGETTKYLRADGTWATVDASGGGAWGEITGDIEDQTDLIAMFDTKSNNDHNHDDRYFTESETNTAIGTAIANLVDSSPATLDTLNELAAALGDDPNFATTVTNLIGTKAPINNPIFTGTVQGITKAMVGLSNVINESKETMFTNPIFTGVVKNDYYAKKSFVLPGPGPNAGPGVWYVRLHSASIANISSLRVTVQGTWNYAPIMGWLIAEYSYYTPGNGGLSSADFRVTSTSGEAYNFLRLGALTIENDYLSFPIFSANTNSPYVTIEWDGNGNVNPTYTEWSSASLPALNKQIVKGDFEADGYVKGTSFKTTNWTFEESGSDLLIKRGSTTLFKLTSAGKIESVDEQEAFVTL